MQIVFLRPCLLRSFVPCRALGNPVELEQRAITDPLRYWEMATVLAAAGWFANSSAKSGGPGTTFEESAFDELIALGL
jgi:hypothetical protein